MQYNVVATRGFSLRIMDASNARAFIGRQQQAVDC